MEPNLKTVVKLDRVCLQLRRLDPSPRPTLKGRRRIQLEESSPSRKNSVEKKTNSSLGFSSHAGRKNVGPFKLGCCRQFRQYVQGDYGLDKWNIMHPIHMEGVGYLVKIVESIICFWLFRVDENGIKIQPALNGRTLQGEILS